jgi:hypothetical protein
MNSQMNGYVYYGVAATNNKTQIKRTEVPGWDSVIYELPVTPRHPNPACLKLLMEFIF